MHHQIVINNGIGMTQPKNNTSEFTTGSVRVTSYCYMWEDLITPDKSILCNNHDDNNDDNDNKDDNNNNNNNTINNKMIIIILLVIIIAIITPSPFKTQLTYQSLYAFHTTFKAPLYY